MLVMLVKPDAAQVMLLLQLQTGWLLLHELGPVTACYDFRSDKYLTSSAASPPVSCKEAICRALSVLAFI